MKIPLIYGTLMALVGALVTYGLFFAGYHDSPDKIQSAQWVSTAVGFVAGVACLALAMRERRAQSAPEKPWTYGSALGVGVLTGLWAVLLGCIFGYLYFAVINPQFGETLYQAQVANMEAKGMSSSQIETAGRMMHKLMTPGIMLVMQAISGMFWCTILSLIIAIFFRRRSVPVEAAQPSELPPVV